QCSLRPAGKLTVAAGRACGAEGSFLSPALFLPLVKYGQSQVLSNLSGIPAPADMSIVEGPDLLGRRLVIFFGEPLQVAQEPSDHQCILSHVAACCIVPLVCVHPCTSLLDNPSSLAFRWIRCCL